MLLPFNLTGNSIRKKRKFTNKFFYLMNDCTRFKTLLQNYIQLEILWQHIVIAWSMVQMQGSTQTNRISLLFTNSKNMRLLNENNCFSVINMCWKAKVSYESGSLFAIARLHLQGLVVQVIADFVFFHAIKRSQRFQETLQQDIIL